MTARWECSDCSIKDVFADSRSTIKEKTCSNDCRASEQAVADTQPYKATGVSALTPAPVFTSTRPRERTQSKRASLLSLRSPGVSRHGADNERLTV